MRRREVIASLLSGAIATAARAQTGPHISILHSGFPHRTPIHLLLEALASLGYENGRTAQIEVLGGEGNIDRLNALVAHLTTQRPQVIIAITAPAVTALKQARLPTQIVFAFVPDPVGLGLVESLAHPAGNFTGTTYGEADLGGKRLEFLVDALPATKRVAVLWGGGFPQNLALLESARRFASARAIEVFAREVRGVGDLAPAFGDAAQAGAEAIIFLTDNLMFGHRKEVAELALGHTDPALRKATGVLPPWPIVFSGEHEPGICRWSSRLSSS
jgi:putative ABC transport system substrate-binding protein